MKVAVRSSEAGAPVAKRVEERLRSLGVALTDRLGDADVGVLVGETRSFLSELVDRASAPPLLFVASRGHGVLAEVPANEAGDAVDRLVEERYHVEPVARMRCAWDDQIAYALNEAAILPSVNGTFLSYELRADDEALWQDRGDGVLVTTPTGSTAYARSAGGPVVLSAAPVFGVVPISSESETAPLIVPQSVTLEVVNIESGGGAQLVIDGHSRHKVGRDGVRIVKADDDLRLIRFEPRRHAEVLGRVRPRRDIGVDLDSAPPSARFVLKVLEHEGPFTAAQLARATGLTSRTVRSAIRELSQRGLIVRRGSLRDARTSVYDVAHRGSEERFSSRSGGQ